MVGWGQRVKLWVTNFKSFLSQWCKMGLTRFWCVESRWLCEFQFAHPVAKMPGNKKWGKGKRKREPGAGKERGGWRACVWRWRESSSSTPLGIRANSLHTCQRSQLDMLCQQIQAWLGALMWSKGGNGAQSHLDRCVFAYLLLQEFTFLFMVFSNICRPSRHVNSGEPFVSPSWSAAQFGGGVQLLRARW